MDIQTIFKSFLDKTVNLNKDRVTRIQDAQRILTDFIKGKDEFKVLYVDTVPQGSFRQKTITKPVGEDASFDVDLLIKLKQNQNWSPAEYHSNLAKVFKDSGRYEDLTDTSGKTRCVTINYGNDFHVDLVPAVEFPDGIYICNKNTDQFEKTDGDGYAQWFERQDVLSNGYLVPVVRLLKYLRDSQGEFDTKSIILTTIAGMQVRPGDNYSSLPEAFSTILTRMNEFLSQFDNAPSILNPAMPGETFDRHWKSDKKGFTDLKEAIGTYSDIASDAVSATDKAKAIKFWQELFGGSFSATDSNSSTISRAIPSSTPINTPSRSFTPHSPYANE